MRSAKKYLLTVLISAAAALFIRHFVLEVYKVTGDHMRPALLAGDYIVIDKRAYFSAAPGTHRPLGEIRLPKRGDAVVFLSPKETKQSMVKRVLALPGDHVVFKNGSWTVHSEVTGAAANTAISSDPRSFHVPSETLFVVNEQRPAAGTDDDFGYIPVRNLKGRVLRVLLSYDAQAGALRWERFGAKVP